MSQPEVPDPLPGEPAVHPDEATRIPLAIEDWLTVLVMAALALITFANVLVRYFTDQSFAWTEEISVFLMIVLSLSLLTGWAGQLSLGHFAFVGLGGLSMVALQAGHEGVVMWTGEQILDWYRAETAKPGM